MDEITTIQQAKACVSKRYLFGDNNYPILLKLNDDERKVFIITHCMLSIYKNMHVFLTEVEKVLYNITVEPEYILIEASAEIMINIMKIAEITGAPLNLHSEVWHFREEYKDVLKYSGKIALECQKFDRDAVYRSEALQTAIAELWHQFIKIINFEKLLFYEEIYRVIGILM